MQNDPAAQAPDPGSDFKKLLEDFRLAGLAMRERIDAWRNSDEGKKFAALGASIKTYLASEEFKTIADGLKSIAENKPTLIGGGENRPSAATTAEPKGPMGFKP